MHDVIIIGAGPAGLTAAIVAARSGARVLVLEAAPTVGRKLLASGGGRCNLTNTLPVPEFMARFGRQGRFMQPALAALDSPALQSFLAELGVQTHAPDGRRVFPVGHRARSVLDGLTGELSRLGVTVHTDCRVLDLNLVDGAVTGVHTDGGAVPGRAVVLATGGCGYPSLGGDHSGQTLAAECGHGLVPTHPGMVPLVIRETWFADWRADTIGNAVIRVRRPGKQRIEGRGDLIFTRDGLAGPVILDLAREITPLLADGDEVPLELELSGHTESWWHDALTRGRERTFKHTLRGWLYRTKTIPRDMVYALPLIVGVDPDHAVNELSNRDLSRLAAVLGRVTVTVTGHAGWNSAMVMRGGVRLKDVRPQTLASRLVDGLCLAGEVLDLDGPCGGFNLQWAFASGYLAGGSAAALACS